MAADGVASDPFAAIGGSHRNPSGIVELYLAGKDIGLLEGFERFGNLQYLWLSRNKLRKLGGLENNVRLLGLHLSYNPIASIAADGVLGRLVNLEELVCDHCRLEDLFAHLSQLRRLRRLRVLDLSGNPLADETGYRLFVIQALPWLVTLDRLAVTDDERRAATRQRRAEFDLDAESRGAAAAKSRAPRDGADEALARAIVEKMAEHVHAKRILLRDHWASNDRQSKGHCTAQDFERVLKTYALWPAAPNEQAALLRAFAAPAFPARPATAAGAAAPAATRPASSPAMPALVGGPARSSARVIVDYAKFCAAVEPRGHRGRDLALREQQALTYALARAPDVSVCVQLATKRATFIKAREHRRDAAARARMVGGAALRPASSNGADAERPRLDTFRIFQHDNAKSLSLNSAQFAKTFRRTGPIPKPDQKTFVL